MAVLKQTSSHTFLALSLDFEYNYNKEKYSLPHKAFISGSTIVQKKYLNRIKTQIKGLIQKGPFLKEHIRSPAVSESFVCGTQYQKHNASMTQYF